MGRHKTERAHAKRTDQEANNDDQCAERLPAGHTKANTIGHLNHRRRRRNLNGCEVMVVASVLDRPDVWQIMDGMDIVIVARGNRMHLRFHRMLDVRGVNSLRRLLIFGQLGGVFGRVAGWLA